jgi:hypothetical protein
VRDGARSSAMPDATNHGRIVQRQAADIDSNFFIRVQRNLPESAISTMNKRHFRFVRALRAYIQQRFCSLRKNGPARLKRAGPNAPPITTCR